MIGDNPFQDQLDKEAEEATAELKKIREEQAKEAAERLADAEKLNSQGPVDIDELISGTDITDPDPALATDGKKDVVAPVIDVALQAEIARLTADLAKSEERFKSTFGNFNKSGMAELAAEVKELRAQVAQSIAAPAVHAPEIPTADHDDLVKEVGEKPASIIEALQAQVASLETALNDVTGKVNATGEKAGQHETALAQVTAQNYYSTLDSLTPDWRKINGDDTTAQNPKYTEFLEKSIPGTDLTYDKVIKSYHEQGNAVKVAEIFNLFKASEVVVAPAAADEEEEIITETTKTGGGSPSPKPKNEKRTYTQKEVDDFDYRLINRMFKDMDNPEVMKKIEAMNTEIQLAGKEGRVRR